MDLIYFMVPLALCLGGLFVTGFLFAVCTGQFDDVATPAHRILLDEEKKEKRNEP